MKNTYLLIIAIALFWTSQLSAQVSITTDGSSADGSAMLDVKSTSKGVLFPRMTTAQRDAIVSPAHSLIIFNLSTNCFEGYNTTNSTWEQVYCLSCDPPGAAGTISGTTPVCASQTGVSYSVPAISGATGYVWAYSGTGFSIASGSNTNSITADFSSATAGNLTVYGTNSCGNGTVSANYAITIAAIPGAPTAGTHVPSETQIVWNWNTVSEATGYKYNTVNDYGTATDNAGSTSYTQTGLTCNAAYTLYVWAYNACGNSSATTLNQTTSACGGAVPCPGIGSSFTVTHTAGAVAPVSKTVTYGVTYVDFYGSDKCVITQNLGADHQATDVYDDTEASAGWYWQFNRQQGYKYDDARIPDLLWNTINENSDWTIDNDPCQLLLGSGWRLLTVGEWWEIQSIYGLNDIADAYASALRIHTSGFLDNYGNLAGRDQWGAGVFWTNTQDNNTSASVSMADEDHFGAYAYYNKTRGHSIRCVKD